ncbi:ABC transporter ATP-binding protein [Arthrobacter sp. Sa2CUA1]|uniref:ABC transporter ATP-binding protein n=1 Tax=Arthrobacter gallicola TaxID=2762225 RepID=A0ABR8UT41_9MICC|nr:ATP-binding cassette domain-containing protein [Arthrobacter gallicola]MBD7995537.1 ABC transporter ATP-binding protein [Arthrobacter gallicola]
MTTEPLLQVNDLEVTYQSRGLRRTSFKAVAGVDLQVQSGETIGLVGESGSGKSTIGRAILGMAPVTAGRIEFAGRNITHLPRRDRRTLASDIQVIFQDPYSSLSPSLTIGDTLAEPLRASGASRTEASRRIGELLDLVHLPSDALQRMPREFSGGQRQRVAIARSLALEPRFIVCDEPVSALDLSTQARVIDLLIEVQRRTGVSYLFISHDLDVIRVMSHRIAVMYRGRIVETGDGEQISTMPTHPYTQRLLLASPLADPAAQRVRRKEFQQLPAAEFLESSDI